MRLVVRRAQAHGLVRLAPIWPLDRRRALVGVLALPANTCIVRGAPAKHVQGCEDWFELAMRTEQSASRTPGGRCPPSRRGRRSSRRRARCSRS
eukprot:1216104-Prymnesium_polylepis.1